MRLTRVGFRTARAVLSLSVLVLALNGCGGGEPQAQTVAVAFAAEAAAWAVGSSDYGDDTAPTAVTATVVAQPAPLSGSALQLAGDNRSDDLFAFVSRPVRGLVPGVRYQATWLLTVVAEVPQGCFGVGGSPGEGVTVKAGVAERAPQRVRVVDEWRFSQDKGDQTQGGPEAALLGNLASSGTDCVAAPAEHKTMRARQPQAVLADAQGRLWLWVGWDSGYEASSSLKLVTAEVHLTPVSP